MEDPHLPLAMLDEEFSKAKIDSWYKAYDAAFNRAWSRPKRLDEEGCRQWDERFLELGKIIAWMPGLANRLNEANLDGQNRHLKTAVLLLQAATNGQSVSEEFRNWPKTRDSFRFVDWLPFVRDDLFSPANADTFCEPPIGPDGASESEFKAAIWLFGKGPIESPEIDKEHLDYRPPSWMVDLTHEKLLEQCYSLKEKWRLPEEGGVFDPNQEIRELKAGLVTLRIETPTGLPTLHCSVVERVRGSSTDELRLFDDFQASVDTIIAAVKKSMTVEAADSRLHAPPRSSAKSEKFAGGLMVFFEDRVELCGADICSGPRSGRPRQILELLRVRRPDGHFMSYSVKSLADEVGTNVPGLIRDLRGRIRKAMKILRIEVGDDDVIESGGPGYRLSKKLTVQLKDGRNGRDDVSIHGTDGPNPDGTDGPDLDGPDELNGDQSARRAWIVEELAANRRVNASNVASQFGCSPTTAKRDIAELKKAGKIHFEGSAKTGYYRSGPKPRS